MLEPAITGVTALAAASFAGYHAMAPGSQIYGRTLVRGANARQLALTYGITAQMSGRVRDVNTAIALAKKELLRSNMAKQGDVFLLVAGIPFGKRGGTNSLMIQTL